MAVFFVPQDCSPGAQIKGLGLIRAGSRFVWEVPEGQKVNIRLVPLDQEAYDLLVAAWGAEEVMQRHGEFKLAAPVLPDPGGRDSPPKQETIGDEMTPAEAAAVANPEAAVAAHIKKRKRASDE